MARGTLGRALGALVWCGGAALVSAQTPAASSAEVSIAFEVASVKPNPVPPHVIVLPKYASVPIPHATGNRYSMIHATVQDLVMQAYGAPDYRITGLADWAKAPFGEHYDVEAKAAGEGTPSTGVLQSMLRSLLAERFQLKLHREKKELPVYVLVVMKSGAKFRPLGENEAIPRFAGPHPAPATQKGRFDNLLRLIRTYADRPVIDETGLSGNYEFADLGLGQFAQARRQDPLEAQNILSAALVQKLGLKLEATKRVTEMLVIDRVERPSEN